MNKHKLNCFSVYNKLLLYWRLKVLTVLLIFQSVYEQHTDVNLIKEIKIIINFYNIIKCFFTIITDYAFNNRIIIKALSNIITIFKNVYYMSCFTYIIQFTVKMLLKHVIIKAENDKEEK